MVATQFACFVVFGITGIIAFDVLLSPIDPLVRENDPVTLTCSLIGNGVVSFYTWSLFNGSSQRQIGLSKNDCTFPFEQMNTTLYNYSCPTERQMLIIIKRVERKNAGEKYQCNIGLTTSENKDSAYSTLQLKIPITSVSMTYPLADKITSTEGTSVAFQCVTSGGLPEARVNWFKDMRSPDNLLDDFYITNSLPSVSIVDHLKVTTSNLTFSVERSDNGMRVYCIANNGEIDWLSAKKPLVTVNYPPSIGPVIQEGDKFTLIENAQSKLSCFITGGNPLPSLAWTCYNGIATNMSDGENVTQVVTWSASREEDSACTCRSSHYSGNKNVSISITVLYSPTIPTFTIGSTPVNGTVKVIQGNSLSVKCFSKGKPVPGYIWRYSNGTTVNSSVLVIANVQASSNGGFTCEVENTMQPTRGDPVTKTERGLFNLQVLYPPTRPEFHYSTVNGPLISSRTIDVIRGDNFSIACVSDGNPTPRYKWTGQAEDNNILRITGIIGNKTATCTASNTMAETVGENKTVAESVDIFVLEQYPPSTALLQYIYNAGSTYHMGETLSVIANKTFNVTCFSDSRPFPSYSWNTAESVVSNTLTFRSINRSQYGVYTCTVTNAMLRSFDKPGSEVIGRIQKNFTLDVLYAPEIKYLQNVDIVEGQSLNVPCMTLSGNPSVFTFLWKRQNDETEWSSQNLSIPVVQRKHASNYNCTVKNIMKPTAETEINGIDSKSFYLNVWYNSSITSFTVNGKTGSIEVSESDSNLLVRCDVDSNPESTIILQHKNKTLKTADGEKSLDFSINEAKCTDAGQYVCIGHNQYNTRQASEEFSLLVRCSPRPSPFVSLNENVTSALHMAASLMFTAIAYPDPFDYMWFKKKETNWIQILNSSETIISTVGLETKLTVSNVTESSIGAYKLTVENEISVWEQLFYLIAADVPNSPENLVHIEEKTTDTSVFLQWTAGFNGGLHQTFVLQYRKIGMQQWTSLNISETSGANMNYTVEQLSSDTQYEVMLYATNTIGRSKSAICITVSTKKSETFDTQGALIGGAVGGGLGFAVVLFGVVVAVIFVRRKQTKRGIEASQLALHKNGRQQTEEDSSDEDVMVENKMYESAGQIMAKDEPVYNKPSKKVKVDAKNADVYAVVDKSKKKENQKKKNEKQKQIKHQGDIYENAPDKSTAGNNTYGNAAFEDNPYENPERSRPSLTPKKYVNQDGLIYADLAFNDQPKGQKKLVIHGLDEMTTYVQVDFNKKADPLPDSDTEEQSENKKK